ncbi:hypothetical protein E2C01_053159 [Portunus trituberculatus]|uniref:Uncharacterized protein n=1 Tax=Portunus trituberculatus TaxID=210409 RepID=A0A5B7GR97_PORTR|nr:hypothetical protein [Portunus trituberculatus]
MPMLFMKVLLRNNAMIRVHGAGMMELDEEGVVTLDVSHLEVIEGDEFADTSNEEIILDDLAVNEVISKDNSATLTASSESNSSDEDTSQSADESSVQTGEWTSMQGDVGPPVSFTGASGFRHPPK